MTRAGEMLRQGRTVLESEVGARFAVGGVSFTGLRSDRERLDPASGTVRETVISVLREAFGTLPAIGAVVTDGANSWRLADVRPASNGRLNLFCIGPR